MYAMTCRLFIFRATLFDIYMKMHASSDEVINVILYNYLNYILLHHIATYRSTKCISIQIYWY